MDKIIADFSKTFNITMDEGKKYIQEIVKQSERAYSDLDAKTTESMKKWIKSMGFVTKEDVINIIEEETKTVIEKILSSSKPATSKTCKSKTAKPQSKSSATKPIKKTAKKTDG